MKKLLILFFAFSSVTGFAQETSNIPSITTRLILIRHAEKKENSKDPELSEEGNLRAQKLNDLFMDVKIDKLYSTPYNRTKQTLEVIATKNSLEIENYNPNDPTFSSTLLNNNIGKTVLVVGHSNTIPTLANKLIGENKYKQLEENEFGKIWILTFLDKNLSDCVLLNY